MWKLEQPTSIDLQNYENLMLHDLYDRVDACGMASIKDNLIPLLPDGSRDLSTLRILLTGGVYASYQVSETLMGQIFAGYSRAELNLYIKAKYTETGKRTVAQNNLITKYHDTVEELLKVMGYKQAFGNVKKAYQVTEWKGAKACTYCNRNYIFTISTGNRKKDKVARPELDHWYAKSKYPLLSMNYFNLIPSCSTCNSSVKGSSDFDVTTHVHPYLQKKSNPSFSFCYNPAAPQWEKVTIDDRQASDREKSTIDAFKLKTVYNCHADLEAKELYDLAVRHGARYLKDLLGLLKEDFPDKAEQDIYRMLFGAELEPHRFGERPMSKFKYDLLKQMRILKNGHYM